MKPEIIKAIAALKAKPLTDEFKGSIKALEWVLTLYKPRKRFVKPTIEEVIDYFEEKECPEPILNAHTFYDYYESINWKVGKNKMHNWKSAVSGWIRRNNEGRQNMPTNYVQDTTSLSDNEAHMQRMRRMTGHGD